jgi:hypothetical protein
VLRVEEQPIVTAMSELLGDGGAVRIEEKAELGLARSELFLEFIAIAGCFRPGVSLGR